MDDTPSATPIVGADDLDAQIARLETDLARLKKQRADRQAAAFLQTIARTIPIGIAFSARELFQHRVNSPALAAAFTDAGIYNARILGKRLRALRGHGLDRVGADHDGAIWTCSV